MLHFTFNATGWFRFDRRARAVVMRSAGLAAMAFLLLVLGARNTQDVYAFGGSRTLTIHHAHTKETETVTYKRGGSFDRSGLDKLNWLLRDWRMDEPTRMDPNLFDLMWEVQREAGSSGTINVVSAYRSPQTNAMLRRRSSGVARHSQHMNGKALDFTISDVPISRLREIAMRMQAGGVGFYPNARNPWVHLDTGSVRHWPKVPRSYLVRLFPDEKTVHIPADGKPLAGFEQARAMIEARGGSVSSGYIDIAEGRATGKSLFAILFGGGDEDDEIAPRGRGRQAARGRGRSDVAAYAPPEDTSSVYALLTNRGSGAERAEPPRPAPTVAVRTRGGRKPIEAPVEAPAPVATQPVERPQPVEPQKPEPTVAVAAVSLPNPRPAQLASLVPPAPPAPPARAVEDEAKRADVPLPPRRPRDLIDDQPKLADVPLPPVRPGDLREPATEVAALPKPADVPLPTPRPLAFAAVSDVVAGVPASLTRGLRPTIPTQAPEVQAPVVPDRAPAKLAARSLEKDPVRTNSVAKTPRAAPVETGFDRGGMAAVMTQARAADAATRVMKLEPAIQVAMNTTVVAHRMDAGDDTKLDAGRFSGSAIRPVRPSFVTN